MEVFPTVKMLGVGTKRESISDPVEVIVEHDRVS